MKPKYSWHNAPTWGSRELKENWFNLFLLAKHIFKIAFTKGAVLIVVLFIIGMVAGLIDLFHITEIDLILILFLWWCFWVTMTVLRQDSNNQKFSQKINELEEKIEELESRIDEHEPDKYYSESEEY